MLLFFLTPERARQAAAQARSAEGRAREAFARADEAEDPARSEHTSMTLRANLLLRQGLAERDTDSAPMQGLAGGDAEPDAACLYCCNCGLAGHAFQHCERLE